MDIVSLFEAGFRSFTCIFLLQELFWNFSGNHTLSQKEPFLEHLPKLNTVAERIPPSGMLEERGPNAVQLNMGVCSAEWTVRLRTKPDTLWDF